MTTRSTSPFTVTAWEPAPYGEAAGGPQLSRVTVRKAFAGGDLTGDSVGEGLLCVADGGNLAAGAGYVISERVSGTLQGRTGSFVLQHWGHSGPGFQQTAGHIVHGSGTGELAGISGTVTMGAGHTLVLDWSLAAGA